MLNRFPYPLNVVKGNRANSPICNSTLKSNQVVIQKNCEHLMHASCLKLMMNSDLYKNDLNKDIVCQHDGCVDRENGNESHPVEISNEFTCMQTNKEIARMKEAHKFVGGCPAGWIKTSHNEFTFKHVISPGEEQRRKDFISKARMHQRKRARTGKCNSGSQVSDNELCVKI